MLPIFRVQFQRIRIILGEISQIKIAIKQVVQEFSLHSSVDEAYEHLF